MHTNNEGEKEGKNKEERDGERERNFVMYVGMSVSKTKPQLWLMQAILQMLSILSYHSSIFSTLSLSHLYFVNDKIYLK